jgi:hypothetical protein
MILRVHHHRQCRLMSSSRIAQTDPLRLGTISITASGVSGLGYCEIGPRVWFGLAKFPLVIPRAGARDFRVHTSSPKERGRIDLVSRLAALDIYQTKVRNGPGVELFAQDLSLHLFGSCVPRVTVVPARACIPNYACGRWSRASFLRSVSRSYMTQ